MTFAPVTLTDALLGAADTALRTLFAPAHAGLASPARAGEVSDLTPQEAAHAARLMRVNHVGEVCAQALYTAQALATPDPVLRAHFSHACLEETNHLAWTAERLATLGSRPSLLNPLWYAGSYLLGAMAAKLGDATSLGFVVETERQVEAHLDTHLQALPIDDVRSRAIVTQMRDDEVAHGAAARALGAADVPLPVRLSMQAMSTVMTTTAYYI